MTGAQTTGGTSSSSTLAPQPHTEFHFFPELPYDVRFLIWKIINGQSRILECELVEADGTDSLSPPQTDHNIITRFVNQESRKIAEIERQNLSAAMYKYSAVFITNFQSYRFTTITAFKGIRHLAVPVYTPDHTQYDYPNATAEEAQIAAQSLVQNLSSFPDLETLDIYTQSISAPSTSLSQSKRRKRMNRRLVSTYGTVFKKSRKAVVATLRFINQAIEGTNMMDPTNIKEFDLFRLTSKEKERIQAYLPRLKIRIMKWESENLS